MKNTFTKESVKRIAAVAVGTAMALAQFAGIMASEVYSAQVYAPQAAVSFTFDDALSSTYTRAMPILKDRGIKGVMYANTGYMGKSGYMSWTQTQDLQNKYGWEIGSHSVTHPLMSTLSDSQIKYEVEQSKKDLVSHGINPVSFATPYGDYDNRVVSAIAKQFEAHRPFHDRESDNIFPYNRYMINVQSVEKSTTVTQVKGWVDHAKATNTWLVLVFHEVVSSKASDQYDVTESTLKSIADYVKSSGIKVSQVKDMIKVNQTNIFDNSSFESGMTAGWTTENSTQVKIDTNTNGAMPNSKSSVALNGTSTAVHLFSKKIAVSANDTYAFKAFVNQVGWKTGEYGFYVDEYDAQGNWISGKWLRGMFNNDTNKSNDVNEFGFVYQPTSWNVSTMMLEVYMTAGSSGRIYVDNVEMYKVFTDSTVTPPPSATPAPSVSPSPTESASPTATASATPTASASATPKPSVTPTASASATPRPSVSPSPTVTVSPSPTATATVVPTPSPVGTNLVRNSNMGAAENGFALYWKADDASVIYDTNSKGCSGAESIIMKANNTVNVHLVNTKLIAVDSTKTYDFGTCVIVGTGTGEFGYYLDEYDANGNWISGQWLGAAAAGTHIDWFVYTPSSSAVKYTGIQYYKTAGSTFEVNVDRVSFYVR